MPKRIAVVISEDPHMTARPVEALRIALGLCAGEHDTTVVLLGPAVTLLGDDTEEIIDADVLEKYLPSFKQLGVPFVIAAGTPMTALPQGFSVTTRTADEIRQFVRSADRSLVF
jgi:hypothetical protein